MDDCKERHTDGPDYSALVAAYPAGSIPTVEQLLGKLEVLRMWPFLEGNP